MWAEAAKWVAKFPEAVMTAFDADGYPVSVRQTAPRYDAASGTMPLVLPEALGAVAGPANVLCHFHDENLWNLRSIQLKGRIEQRDGGWVFVTTAFTPPSTWAMIFNVRRATKKYLAKRGLERPRVDFDVIAKLWVRARALRAGSS